MHIHLYIQCNFVVIRFGHAKLVFNLAEQVQHYRFFLPSRYFFVFVLRFRKMSTGMQTTIPLFLGFCACSVNCLFFVFLVSSFLCVILKLLIGKTKEVAISRTHVTLVRVFHYPTFFTDSSVCIVHSNRCQRIQHSDSRRSEQFSCLSISTGEATIINYR